MPYYMGCRMGRGDVSMIACSRAIIEGGRRLGMSRWLICLRVAVAMLVACQLLLGCSRPPRSSGKPEISNIVAEIVGVRLSADGTVLAVDGVPGGTRLQDSWDMGVWFVAADEGKVIHSTPPGWMCLLPTWGPGTSYVQQCAPADRRWGLYCSHSAREEARLLAAESPEYRLMAGYPMPWLDVAVFQTEETTAADNLVARVYAVPMSGGNPSEIAESRFTGRLIAVIRCAEDLTGALFLCSGTVEGPGHTPGISAFAYPSGDMRWRARLGETAGIITEVASCGDGTAILAEEPLLDTLGYDSTEWWTANEEDEAQAKLWVINLATGSSRLLAQLPLACTFLSVLPDGSGSEWQAFCGGIHSIYRVTAEAGRSQVTQVVRGSDTARPGGVRISPEHGAEAYLGTRHCLWRCRLKTGEVEVIWGEPADGDDPPEIVASID